jgi:hypothetical protein
MRKLFVVSLFLGLMVSIGFAQALIGAKAAGMGGAGVANVTDLAAAYYNPAGLMKAGLAEFKLSLNPSYTDYQKVLDAFSRSTDPTKILQDNFSTDLSFQGDLAGIIGLNVNKIGISAILLPLGNYAGDPLSKSNTISLNKGANALQGSATYATRLDTILTLGYTFSLPGLPIASLDTGINLKSINAVYGTISATITDTSAPYLKGMGSGTAFDLGARTNLDVPIVGSLALGLTMRDLGGQINYKRKQEIYYFNNTTQTITKGAESDLTDKSISLDSSTILGAAVTLPMVNLGIAADLEMKKDETVTHFGLEYPLLVNLLIVRAGAASSPSISKTTLGAKINLPFLTLDGASIMDGKNSSLSSWVVDFSAGF